MDQHDPQDNQPQKTPESRQPQSSGFFLVFAASICVVLILISAGYLFPREDTVQYRDLLRLIDASKREERGGPLADGASGTITVERDGRSYSYSGLQKIVVGPLEVRGEIRRLDPSSGQTAPIKMTFRTPRGRSDPIEKEITDSLRRANLDWDFEAQPVWWQQYLIWLLGPILMVLLLIFLLRKFGGAGSPIAFGRSRGRLYAQEDVSVTFNDVAGIDEAVDEVKEIVDFFKSPERYQRLGGRIPKGVLLVGPPGTGKTLLARAIASEAGVPFFSLSGSDFVEMYVGVGAARVRDSFQQAVSRAPCIIFIDEMDALGKSRGLGNPGGHDEREQTLNALLVEMDGFDANAGVMVMAATNRPEMLDPALLRRFDRHVLVDRPDVRGREEILKVHVRRVKLDDTVNLREIAGITSGFAGADLANLVNEATLLAARRNLQAVSMQEFNEAVERVTAGLEKKKRVMSAEEKQRLACHESGHALVAFSLPNTDPVHKVSIIPRGIAALGYTMQRPEGDRYLMTQPELDSRIQVLLAGTIAEELLYTDISTGAQNDLERATEIARSMVMDFGMSRLGRIAYRESGRSAFLAAGDFDRQVHTHSEQTCREIDQEVKRIIDEAMGRVKHILEVRKTALVAISRRLIEVEMIGAEELRSIIEQTSPGPVLVPGTTPPQVRTVSDTTQSGPSTSREAAN